MGWGKSFLALLLLVPATGLAGTGQPASVVAVFTIESRIDTLSRQEVETLTDFLGTKLGEGGRLLIIPRQEIRRRLQGQKKNSYKNCYDQSCQIELGRELAAQYSVAASIGRVGSQCLVTAALYDLKKAATEATATARSGCDADSLLGAVEKVAAKLSAGKGTGEPAQLPPQPRKPQPQDATPGPGGTSKVVYVPTPARRTKSSWSACLWGLLLPGGGLFYTEDYGWGVTYLILTLGGAVAGVVMGVNYDMKYFGIGWGGAMAIDLAAIIHGMIAAAHWQDPAYEAWQKSQRQGSLMPAGAAGRLLGEPPPASRGGLVIPLFSGRF